MSEGPVTNGAPPAEDFEKLLVNNEAMARVENYLNRFNPIRVMKMERMEIRHSAILAWLLDPRESHGLNDKFLKAFLGEALRGRSAFGCPTALDIASADFRDAIVRREWQNIDIFIHTQSNGWGFVVENKFDSKQRVGQLSGYLEKVLAGLDSEADDLTFRGIFLTLDGEDPEDPRYAPITYETVCQLLSRFVTQDAHLLTAEVRTFLQHYVEIIEEEVGMSSERSDMEKLARQLYRENKKVLDFIIKNGAGSDFSIAAEHVFGEGLSKMEAVVVDGLKFRFGHLDQKMISFLPESWWEASTQVNKDWLGCEKWWAGQPLIAWIQLWPRSTGISGLLGVYGEVGPIIDHDVRKGLIEAIQQGGDSMPKGRIRFQRSAADEGKRFSKFLSNNFMEIKDIQDGSEIAEAIKKLLKKFEPEFEVVGSTVDAFVKSRLLRQTGEC